MKTNERSNKATRDADITDDLLLRLARSTESPTEAHSKARAWERLERRINRDDEATRRANDGSITMRRRRTWWRVAASVAGIVAVGAIAASIALPGVHRHLADQDVEPTATSCSAPSVQAAATTFRDAPLRTIVDHLNATYAARIAIADSTMADTPFTITIGADEPLADVMQALADAGAALTLAD